MDEYRINVTKTGSNRLDGVWAVGFVVDHTHPANKEVTFCFLRKKEGNGYIPFSGCSVKNPKDEHDEYRGKHDAFKRAVQAMLCDYNDKYFLENICGFFDKKHAESRFRGAFWLACNRPGYVKTNLFAENAGA